MKYTSQGNARRSRARLIAATAALASVWGTAACALVPQAAPAPPSVPAAPAPVQGSPGASQTIEMTRSCDVENGVWVCRYAPPASIIAFDPSAASPPAAAPVLPAAAVDAVRAEEARLMVRCGTATWLSLCTPSDRREARRLRAVADRREALRAEVTLLLSQNQCDAAARRALEGADMTLAVEVRDYCRRPASPTP